MLYRLSFLHGRASDISVDATHPLASPIRLELESGRPSGSWTHVLVADHELDHRHVLGAFCLSPGKRVLFYPSTLLSHEDNPEHPIDHLTLDESDERGRRASHVTLRDAAERHVGGIRVRNAPPGLLFPWFSVLEPVLVRLPEVPRHLSIEFSSPMADLERRMRQLDAGRVQSKLAVLPPPPPTRAFIQADVSVGERGGGSGPVAALVFEGNPLVDLEDHQDLRSVSVDVDLDEVLIRIVWRWVRGSVASPIVVPIDQDAIDSFAFEPRMPDPQ